MSIDTGKFESLKASIAPWLSVRRGAEAVDFYRAAFGAAELHRVEDDAGATVVAAIYEDHGWCIGRVADPFGHHREIGKPLSHIG